MSLTKEDLDSLSDVEVIGIYKNAVQRARFYNSATTQEELDAERNGRIIANQWLKDVEEELKLRKLVEK